MITWEPWDAGTNANNLKDPALQPQYQLGRILAGDFDPYIHRFARNAAAVRGPVMIRLMHEMNGRWYPWGGTVNGNTPDQFVPAWRHIHDIFDQEGATNVTWVWAINHDSRPNTFANRYAVYYPGDKYVDWVALSGFNFGVDQAGSTWQPFNFTYLAPLAYLKTLNKPIVIAEIGSVEDGGSKAAWLTDAYTQIRLNHPEVKAVDYYDSREAGTYKMQDWRIASSAPSLSAFRTAVADPRYIAAPMTTLKQWTDSLTDKDWVYLRSFAPLY
jgi:beta-mannanase